MVEGCRVGHSAEPAIHRREVWNIVEAETFETAQDVFAGAQRPAACKERRVTRISVGARVVRAVPAQDAGVVEPRHPLLTLQVPAEFAIAEEQHTKTVYVRENAIVPRLDEWIGGLFADEHLDAHARRWPR
jgi:hypothetical protein